MLSLPVATTASTPSLINLPSAMPSGNPVVDTIWFRYFPADAAAGVRAPAVVLLPPLGSGEEDPQMTEFAEYLASRGIASAVMALPYHGLRHKRGDEPARHFIDGNLAAVVHNFQQSVSDAGTVAAWMQARPEIDPTRIGIVGISLGAIVAHLAMGIDSTFPVGVAILGGGDLPDLYRHSLIAGIEQMMHPHHYTAEQLRTVAPVDPLTYADRNRPRRVLMIEAARDLLIPPRDATELWNALGRPPIRWIDTNHLAISLFPKPIFKATADFLLAAWAGEDVHAITLPRVDVPTIKAGVIVEERTAPTAALQWQFLPIGHRPDHMALLHTDLGLGTHGLFLTLGATLSAYVDAGVLEHTTGGHPRAYASFHIVF
jgi:dienelactone hydrolase